MPLDAKLLYDVMADTIGYYTTMPQRGGEYW